MLCDLHTHTIISGHAYSTLRENIEEGKKKGLKLLGTSEHSQKMPGSCNNVYFYNMKILKRDFDGIFLLRGAEANIMNYSGELDLTEEKHIRNLDYIIASLHTTCIRNGGITNNTEALIKAMDGQKVRIIGHPDDDRYPIDRESLVLSAKEKGILIELNNSSLAKNSSRKNARENNIEILKLCQKHKVDIIINSDAHVDYQVGDFKRAVNLIEELDFPKEHIVNFDNNEDRLFSYLKIDKDSFYNS